MSDARNAAPLASDLEATGWDVDTAADAATAFRQALMHRPTAVVVGGRLPAGGVAALVRRLRSSAHTAATPAVGVVVDGGPTAGELREAGVAAHVDRPDAAAVDAAILGLLAEPYQPVDAPSEVLRNPHRLAVLRDAELLDRPADESIDALTMLAATLLGTPVALTSLVDENRQFFESQVGLPEPWAGARETPLTHSFCQWVVSTRDTLTVDDAREHPVLRTNLAIRDLGVIAYAGVPLAPLGGHAIGSFCAIDQKPRQWTPDDLATLRDLANVAEAVAALRFAQARGDAGRSVDPGPVVAAAGRGIVAAASLLRRGGPRLGEAERGALLTVVEAQGRKLALLGDVQSEPPPAA